ncbi:PLP-dependent transferase, partial [Micromonospora endophytica]
MVTVDTRAVHAGRDDLAALGVHVPPIDLSTTNPLPSVQAGGDAYETLATGGTHADSASAVYQRLWNPTVARFETALAELEHTTEAVAFASGMAALTAVLLAATRTGKRHLVAVRPLYGGTDHVLATGLLGTEVTWA